MTITFFIIFEKKTMGAALYKNENSDGEDINIRLCKILKTFNTAKLSEETIENEVEIVRKQLYKISKDYSK